LLSVVLLLFVSHFFSILNHKVNVQRKKDIEIESVFKIVVLRVDSHLLVGGIASGMRK